MDYVCTVLNLRRQVAKSEHGETAIAAQRDSLASGKRQLPSKRLRRGVSHRRPVNEPNSLRRGPPFMCRAIQMHAVPVSAKKTASSAASSHIVAARYSGRIGLMPGPFLT